MQRKRRANSNPFKNLDFSEFLTPYSELQKEYKRILTKSKSKGIAFKVIFKEIPDIVYISFSKTKAKARADATRYFRTTMHPMFIGKDYEHQYLNSKAFRISEFDKFSEEGKVPIPQLMENLGATFPCSICGHGNFNLQDYKTHRCYLVEGEGDLNPFTKGYILCYSCYNKYIK